MGKRRREGGRLLLLGVEWRKSENGKGSVALRTFRSGEMNNIPILLEHVDFFYGLDGLDIEFLEGGLQLLVIGSGGFVDLFRLSAWGSFASVGIGELARTSGRFLFVSLSGILLNGLLRSGRIVSDVWKYIPCERSNALAYG